MSELTPTTFAFGRFRYDQRAAKLLLDGREVALPPRELHLLAIFLHYPGDWLGEEWLSRGLWPKAVPPTGELERLLRELAAVLERGADGVTTIQSAKGRGYRWLMPVRTLDEGGGSGGPRPPGPTIPQPEARAGERASPLPDRRSAHRTLLSPRRLALGLVAVFVLAAGLFWFVRSLSQRGGSAAERAAVAADPAALRAAASVELAKGIAAAHQPDLASRRAAIERFEAALALDPRFALAHAALASTLTFGFGGGIGGEGDLERARREAQAALALDPKLADAHASLAYAQLFYDRDSVAARASAARALALDAASIGGRRALAWVNAVEGRFLAALAELANARSPGVFDPDLATDEGSILYLSGRALEARRELTEVVRREPAFRRAHAALAALHLVERRLGAAAFELELYDALATGATSDDARVRQSAAGTWSLPDAGEAARLLGARAESIYLLGAAGSQFQAARIFVQFGERDRALAALARALERRESAAALARVDPAFAPLRDVAAFRELLDRAGAPAISSDRAGAPALGDERK